MTTQDEIDKGFAMRAMPGGWLHVADNLHCQAVALKRGPVGFTMQTDGNGKLVGKWNANNRSVFLLGGFAMENAIKAFLVYENPSWVANGRLSNQLLSHSLTKLQAKSTTIPDRQRSLWVLREMEAGLESWARYPCALRATQSEDERVLSDKLWKGYLRVMSAYGRKLSRMLGRVWMGPHGAEAAMTYKGPHPLSDE